MGKKHTRHIQLIRDLTTIQRVTLITCLIINLLFVGFVAGERSSDSAYEAHQQKIEKEQEGRLGVYIRSTGVINLFTDRQSIIRLDVTYLHERCHKVWFALLDEEWINRYTKLYEETIIFVSEYAMKNVEEDFAETCTAYILEAKDSNQQVTQGGVMELEKRDFLESLNQNVLIPYNYQ